MLMTQAERQILRNQVVIMQALTMVLAPGHQYMARVLSEHITKTLGEVNKARVIGEQS